MRKPSSRSDPTGEILDGAPWRRILTFGSLLLIVVLMVPWASAREPLPEALEHFEKKVRPVLVKHCYRCHSAQAKRLKGGLRLDLRLGWQKGGESGKPSIIPGKPGESLLLRAIRHENGISAMPPGGPRLSPQIIRDLTHWIQNGAVDPRTGTVAQADPWEEEYQKRLNWWSLKPFVPLAPPEVTDRQWLRGPVDRFILSRLESIGLQPSAEADRAILARRLSYILTGLPPSRETVQWFLRSSSPDADERYVDLLLSSPHFGEHWARHWMDVVHYSDTHGYEWDVPAKNAWRYRDYLIRAFNADLPYQRLILEHIAGDLCRPRLDPRTGINESLIGPMALRLGERRHGDNAAAEGVTQEAVSNMIDTIGKAFLGTTLACAQCHNHKLDAIEQKDYYALAGMLMSSRFSARPLTTVDPNLAILESLRGIKRQLRAELTRLWLQSIAEVEKKIRAIPVGKKAKGKFPDSLAAVWRRSHSSPVTRAELTNERQRRKKANAKNLKLLADFTKKGSASGWRWEGSGMAHGQVADGELVVADSGDQALLHLLPAGRFTHVWSPRLPGYLQSPELSSASTSTFSVQLAGGKYAAYAFIVDRCLHSERMQFLNRPLPEWLTLTAGNFGTLEGSIDRAERRVYFEIATKSLNNYFPPRTGYGGVSDSEIADQRSWFGASTIYQHPTGKPPLDELDRFVPLFGNLAGEKDWAKRLTGLVRLAIERWSNSNCNSEDVGLLNEALQLNLLPNQCGSSPKCAQLIARYRDLEKRLQPEPTIGTIADWGEGKDERLAIRGSYTRLGDRIERRVPRFLKDLSRPINPESSGRLQLAQAIASSKNPLTARVYVNRVWHYLFGEGLVRTPDDFGHLGKRPTHPQLLDYLAQWFLDQGGSTKKLIRLLVTSATWRQSSRARSKAQAIDPNNRLWHHMPLRRLEAEAIRDTILALSGEWHQQLYGPPVEPYRTAEDPMKRLFKGPLDGNGRRSVYLEMTLMEPPRFLALFNQPIPKLTRGRRDVTNVPDQALALLNDPFVIAMAAAWSRALLRDGCRSPVERAERMLAMAITRQPRSEEVQRLLGLIGHSARLRGIAERELMKSQPVWQDAAHAIFNLKELIYVR